MKGRLVWPAQVLNRLLEDMMSLDDEAYNVSKSHWNKKLMDAALEANPKRYYRSVQYAN